MSVVGIRVSHRCLGTPRVDPVHAPCACGHVRAWLEKDEEKRLGRGKLTACENVKPCPNPKCKKPLPRCAVCLQHMGCPDPADAICPTALGSPPHAPRVWKASSSAFGHWMVWCQSCRHGGHADHMREWFERHDECPVSGCNCRCALLDGVRRSYGDADPGA